VNILFDLNHPAHVHLFKNFILFLNKKKHNVVVVARNKDMTYELLKYYNIDYVPLSNPGNGIFGAMLELVIKTINIYILNSKYKFNMAFGTSPSIAILSKLDGVKSMNFNEDDDDVVPLYAYITFPFTTKIINPEVVRYNKWRKKRILYPSYQELAYLHPKNFKPNKEILNKYNLTKGKYVIARFSGLKAYHDIGKKGISNNLWEKIKILCKDYKIITSRENEHQHLIEPWDMHHIISFAKLVISDSQTVTAEAAVLGVPSVRYNSFVGRISYLEELEHKYNLTFGYKPGEDEIMLKKISKLIGHRNIHEEWQSRKNYMLSQKIDFNEWMIHYFNNYINVYYK